MVHLLLLLASHSILLLPLTPLPSAPHSLPAGARSKLTTDACGYQKGGAGTCNSTIFGYPFEPLGNMLADTPKDFKKQTVDVIGTDATAFKDDGYNGTATRAASLLTFVSSFFHIQRLLWPAFWIYILSNEDAR
jgi:hypothetical protein